MTTKITGANVNTLSLGVVGGVVQTTLAAALEKVTISATASSGTINFELATQSVLYYTTAAAGNFTVNIRGNSTTTLNSLMATGQSITLAFLSTQGSPAYYNSSVTVDGAAATVDWFGGAAPSAGNANGIDVYTYTVIKTANATFTVLASQSRFA